MNESVCKSTILSLLRRSVKPNALKADIVRVWQSRNDIQLSCALENLAPEVSRLLLEMPKRIIFIMTKEGRSFIAYTMTFNESLTEEIHEVIKKELVTCDISIAQKYGEIYYTAWQGAPQVIKTLIERKFQTYMHHFFEFERKGLALSLLGANVFSIARCFHAQRKSQVTRKMLSSIYSTVLWMFIQDGSNNNRCNAAQVLFDVYPMDKPGAGREENSLFLAEQHRAMTAFLTDRCHLIRIIAIRQICAIMAEYWLSIPMDIIKQWIKTIIKDLANDSADVEVRRSVYRSLPKLFKNPHAEEYMKEVLPLLKNNFHDVNEHVRAAFVSMLIECKKTTIKYWDVVPVTHIVARLEIEKRNVGTMLVNLIFDSYITPDSEPLTTMDRLASLILMNLEAVRMFFLYSTEQLNARQSMDLIIMILPIVISRVNKMLKRMENKRKERSRRKRKLLPINGNTCLDSTLNQEESLAQDESNEENFHPLIAQGYIDIVSILWFNFASSYEEPHYAEDLNKLHTLCATGIPLLLRYYKNSEVLSSVLFLCSLVPISVLRPVSKVEGMLLGQLKKFTLENKTKDIHIRVQPLCMWGHGTNLLQMAQDWINAALKVTRRGNNDTRPRMGLRLLAVLLDDPLTQIKLKEKNYEQLMGIWFFMSKIKTLVAARMESSCHLKDPPLSDEFLQECFKQYVMLIPTLNGKDKTEEVKMDSVPEIMSLMAWAGECILSAVPNEPPHSSSLDADSSLHIPLPVHMAKTILEVVGDMNLINLVNERSSCVAGRFCLIALSTGYRTMFVLAIIQYISKSIVYLKRYHEEDFFNLFRSVTITMVMKILDIMAERYYDQQTAGKLLENVTEVKNFLLHVLEWSKIFGKSKQKFYHRLANSYVVNLLKILKHEISMMQNVNVLKETKDLPYLAQQLAPGLIKDDTFRSVFLEEFELYFTQGDLKQEPLLILAAFSLLHLLAVDPKLKPDKTKLVPVLESVRKSLGSHKEHLNELNAAQQLSDSQTSTNKLDILKELDVLEMTCRLELLGRNCLELWELDEMRNIEEMVIQEMMEEEEE